MTLFEFHGNWTIEAKDEQEAWDKFSNSDDADNYWIDTYYDKKLDKWIKYDRSLFALNAMEESKWLDL